MSDPYIELAGGEKFYVDNVAPSTYNIKSLAHALSNQCRFTGHCRHFYSVAEHSLLCMLIAEETGLCDPYEALMHDAHEAIIGDMATPWKMLIEDYYKYEKPLARKLRKAFDLPEEMTDGAKRVDAIALFLEAYHLIPSKGEGWNDPLNVRVDALRLAKRDGWRVVGLDPARAKNAFLKSFEELYAKRQDDPWWVNQDINHEPT